MNAGRQSIPILLYHAIAESVRSGPEFAVRPSMFADHLDVIASKGVRTCTVSQLVDDHLRPGNPIDGPLAVITFDDGFANFATAAAPALAARNMSATLYVTSGGIEEDSRDEGTVPLANIAARISVDQLRALDPELVEIGAHSHTHPMLDVIDARAAADEIGRSRDVLERVLDREVTSFAYPHGYHDRRTRQLVIDAGYQSACGVKNAMSSTVDDVYSLARITVTRDTTAEELADILAGTAIGPHPTRELLKTRCWRAVRRCRSAMAEFRS